MTVRPVFALVILALGQGLLAPSVWAQLDVSGAHVTMNDGEVASRFDAPRNETTVTLALRPEGPYGVALMFFLNTYDGRRPIENPTVIQIYAYLHTVNPTQMRRPMFVVDLDRDLDTADQIDLSATLQQPRTPAGELLDGVVEMALVDFSRLLRATTVTANLFGLDFPIRADQQEALWAFAVQVLPESAR